MYFKLLFNQIFICKSNFPRNHFRKRKLSINQGIGIHTFKDPVKHTWRSFSQIKLTAFKLIFYENLVCEKHQNRNRT